MTVTNVHKDPDALSMTITADFAVPVERAWELWADPRQLERWWGPPSHPATVVDHDLTPGGSVTYFMTGPEGEKYRGWWTVLAVNGPRSLQFQDGFADEDGNPNHELPVTTTDVELGEHDDGTRMVITSRFPSAEAMEQSLAMGMEEGITAALGQIDAILATG
ncbi:SRPBCC domain-containing protein [soil metagenome]